MVEEYFFMVDKLAIKEYTPYSETTELKMN